MMVLMGRLLCVADVHCLELLQVSAMTNPILGIVCVALHHSLCYVWKGYVRLVQISGNEKVRIRHVYFSLV